MATTEVETIGVKLMLDAGGFVGTAQEATAAMNKFQQAAMKAGSGASQMKAGAGGAGTGSSSAQMAAVNVPVMVNAESLAVLRAQIVKGLGAIPVTITPQFATQGKYSIQNVMGSMLSTQYGMTQTKGVQVAKQVMEQALGPMPKKAYGGAVQQGRPVLVGERRPEVFTPRSSGTIHPDAERFYREKTRERRHEVELAALEYQQQRQHEQHLRSLSPSRAIRRIRDEALLRLDMAIDRYDQQSPQHLPRRIRGGMVQRGASIREPEAGLSESDLRRLVGPRPAPRLSTFGMYEPYPSTPQEWPATSLTKTMHRQRGGRVSPVNAMRRQRAFDITHRYGNIKGWQNEMWRQQEAAENADRLETAQREESWANEMWERRAGRAQGGPSHKGGLPRGYRIEFYSPEDAAMRIFSTPSLQEPPPGEFKNIKKPVIKGPREAAGIVTVVKKGPKVVATFPFSFSAERSRWGVSTPYGSFHPDYSLTDIEHRRKGLATAAYVKTEKFTGRPIAPSDVQLVRGKAFWSQPERPFGKIFGPRPADRWVLESAERDEANDRARREAERVYEARSAERAAKRASPEYMAAHAIPEPPGWTRTTPTAPRDFLAEARAIQAAHAASLSPFPVSRTPPPTFGQPLPPRRRQRNSPQEQMRRAESYYYGEAYREVDPWATPAHVPQRRPVFGEGFPREGGSRLTFAPSHDPMRRIAGGLVHAGFGALAYRATMENEGGTFPLSGGSQPPKGYAVGIQTGTAQLVPANDPRAFLRAFHEQRRSQMAAGNFPPYVGTWLHEGQIHIDPAAVLGRKREADMVARAKAQLAFFDLKRFEEIPTSSHKLRANAERINQLIMSGRKRMAGGPAFGLSGKPAELLHHLGYRISAPNIEIPPEVSLDIDRIRSMPREHFLAVEPPAAFTAGKSIVIGEAFGNRTGVTLNMATPRPNIPPESARRWRTRNYRHEMEDFGGLLGIHNHPLYKGSRNIWRPSIPDIRGMFVGNERESWVVTPESTMVMRNPGYRRDPGQAAIGRSMAEALSQKLGVDIGQYIGRSNVVGGFTPKFIKEFESPQTLTSLELQKAMMDRVASELGFDWELWKHPTGLYTKFPEKTIPSFGSPLLGAPSPIRPRRSPPADQPGFGFAKGGWIRRMAGGPVGVHQVSVRDLYKLQTSKMQKMEEWESPDYMAHLRDSMRTEGIKEPIQIRVFQGKIADNKVVDENRLHAIVYDGNHRIAAARQMPATFPTLPVQIRRSDSPEFLTPEHIGLKRRCGGGPVHAGTGRLDVSGVEGNYRKMLASASPEQVEAGANWYQTWGKELRAAASRLHIAPEILAAGTAALTPRNAWPGNFQDAIKFAEASAAGLPMPIVTGFSTNLRKAWSIFEGASAHHLSGPKVTPFSGALLGDLNQIVNDLWMKRVATGDLTARGAPAPSLRREMDRVTRLLAKETGYAPAQIQAIIWGTVRDQAIARGAFATHSKRRASGGLALASDPSHGLVHPGGGFASSMVQTAADWARDPFMAIMAWQSQQQSHKARGGPASNGLYIVGEIGKELFVPDRLTHLIPKKVMDQIPKAASGMQVIGQKPNSLFAPPEDGIIIPNRLMDQIPHAAEGDVPEGSRRAQQWRARAEAARQRAERDDQAAIDRFMVTGPTPTRSRVRPVVAPSALLGQTQFGNPAERARLNALQDELIAGGAKEQVAKGPSTRRPKVAIDPIKAILSANQQRVGVQMMQVGGAFDKQAMLETLGVVSPEPGYGRMLPSRTPRGAVASLASLLGVGQEQAKREKTYKDAQQALNTELKVSGPIADEYDKRMTDLHQTFRAGGEPLEHYQKATAALTEQYHGAGKPLEELDQKVATFNEAAKAVVPSTGNVIKNLGVIIGATSLYGIAMSVANVGMEAGSVAVGKLIDQMVGFTPTMTRVTTALADQTLAQGGNYKAALAAQGATAGLSADFGGWIEAALQATTMAKSGAKAYGQISDLFRASIGAGGAPQGLYGGYGGILGTPLMAEQMGGGKGLYEQLLGDINASRGETGIDFGRYIARFGAGAAAGGALGVATGPGAGISIPAGALIGGIGTLVGTVAGDIMAGTIMGGTGPLPSKEAMGAPEKALNKQIQDAMSRAQRREGGPGYQFEYKGEAANQAYKDTNLPTQAKNLAKAGYAMTDSAGNIVTDFDKVTAAAEQLATGLTIADPAEWFKTVDRSLQAQFNALDIQSLINRTIGIPLQLAMTRLQSPYAAAGAGQLPGARGIGNVMGMISSLPGGAGLSTAGYAAALRNLGVSGGVAQQGGAALTLGNQQAAAQQAANAQAIRDATALIANQPGGTNWTGMGEHGARDVGAASQYKALMDDATKASDTLKGLNDSIENLNAVAAQASWANTTRLALRGIADAAGMIAGATGKKAGSALGQIEGQLWAIGRASQALSLALQQREITTQLAVAQFQAPGQTGEERYFAQKEAIVKAGIAQTQLGLSKQTYALSGQEWQIQAKRNLEDAQIAWAAEMKSHDAAALQAASALAIATTSTQISTDLSKASDIYSTASSKFNDMLSTLAQYTATFGSDIGTAGADLKNFGGMTGESAKGVTDLLKAMGYTFKPNLQTGGQNLIAPNGGGTTSIGETGISGPIAVPGASPVIGSGKRAHLRGATGFLGTTTGMSNMTVGEAGTEMIAVLRNPRAVSTGGGATGAVSVKLTDTSISSWMQAIQTKFPKVGLTDTTISAWTKALWATPSALDLSDKTITALGGSVGGGATGATGQSAAASGANMGGAKGSTTPYTAQRISQLAARLSQKLPGLDPGVAAAWIKAEKGVGGNVLGLTYNAGGKQHLYQYNSQEAGIDAAANFINTSSMYKGLRTGLGGNAQQDLAALIASPWNHPYYKKTLPGLMGATGLLGTTLGPTGMIVGEANREAVAILRNPHAASLGSSGGPMNLTININNASVRNDQDISSLARQVAIEVERNLARKGQMFGLRGPAV